MRMRTEGYSSRFGFCVCLLVMSCWRGSSGSYSSLLSTYIDSIYCQSITLKRADFAEKASLESKGSTIFNHAYSGLTSSYALSAWLSNVSLVSSMHLDLVDIAKAFARAKFAEKLHSREKGR